MLKIAKMGTLVHHLKKNRQFQLPFYFTTGIFFHNEKSDLIFVPADHLGSERGSSRSLFLG